MTNGAAIEALMQGPKAKVVKTFNVRSPRAARAARTRRWSTRARSRAAT